MNRKTGAALLSVCSNSGLIVMKVMVGIVSGSVSIISEAIHSAMDLIAALIALFAVSQSDLPPDANHPYGHSKIENVSGVLEALLILGAAGWIVYEAVEKLLDPQPVSAMGLGVVVMLVSALINVLVSQHLYRVAREEESVALEADALHLKADVLTSVGVAAGLGLMLIASYFGYHWYFIDSVVAIGVALFITREGFDMLRNAFRPLLDHSISEQELALTMETIRNACGPGVDYHQLRTRYAGRRRHIDFHLTVPKQMCVERAHQKCDEIEAAIMAVLPNAEVLIHVEPA
ncbi:MULTISPECIES: cation diffusion facilitator family transporter [Vibrio]|nr:MULTISPECIES: cation diffusion facilitator family transporter [Vibrio]NAX20601.1 cation diffusion facilitator family transporter [Vibrio sp. V39_P1S14PM300]